MKRFIGEIVIENPELVRPVVKGIETCGECMEVELHEKERLDPTMARGSTLPGVVSILKIYKNEFID